MSRSAHAGFVLDALEQALPQRRPCQGLIHHSDRGSQYVAIKYTERLLKAGAEPSVGSAGDSYDNALAETINGLFKAEVIWRRGPWRTIEAVELATLEWGGLVQPSPPARTPWPHPASGSRSQLLCSNGAIRYGRITKPRKPPRFPGRFGVQTIIPAAPNGRGAGGAGGVRGRSGGR